jgi:hypothetical protein
LPAERRERLLSTAYMAFARRMLRRLEKRKNQRDIDELAAPVNAAIAGMTRSPWCAQRYRKRLLRLTREGREG